MRSAAAAILALLASHAEAFAAASGAKTSRLQKNAWTTLSVATSNEVESNNAVSTSTPSWDELSETLSDLTADRNEPPELLVTLYRDTNGRCPFCERVWLVLRAKGIPYEEQLISLQNKPDWYKALVPTTLVPAVLFHGEEGSNERRIVWESADIMKALDEEFPNTPKMTHDTPEFEEAVQMNEELQSAGFQFVYAGRNASLTEEEKVERREAFLNQLDRLDSALQENDGQFRLGEEFSAVDALMVPTLERWRYQLPITTEINILDGRPGLVQWFEAMDAFEPYAGRVVGDEYSWTATNSMFLRYFAGSEDDPVVAAAIKRADEAAERLTSSFVEKAAKDEDGKYSIEAAIKLIGNHEAVVKDCTREDPKSQQHIGRAPDANAADTMLRIVASLLLSCSAESINAVSQASDVSPLSLAKESRKDAATAARTVASRLCAPRDMSAPAASILRAVLAVIADRLEEEFVLFTTNT